ISYYSRKSLIIDENGIHEYSAQTQPHLESNHLRYLNAEVPFPIRPLVKRIAYKAYNKQKPQLNADITRDAGKQLTDEFNERANKEVQQANERFIKDWKEPLLESKVYPQRVRILTSEHQLGVRALLLDPTGKAMTFTPVPDVHGWPDIAVRVEE